MCGRTREGAFAKASCKQRGKPVTGGADTCHICRPQSWAHKLNRKVRRLALASALSAKAHEGHLLVLDCLDSSGKTREMAARLREIVPPGYRTSVLLLDEEKDSQRGQLLRRASGNIPGVMVTPAEGLNVWQVLQQDFLVMSRASVEAVVARLLRDNMRGWTIRPAGYESPWAKLMREYNEERRARGLPPLPRRTQVMSAMDRAYQHKIELYPGQSRPT